MSKIMLHIARSLAISSLVFCVTCLCSCATGPQVQEAISLPFLSGGDWEFGYETEDEIQIVSEWVRPGQTVDNWTEMITVQTLNKAFVPESVEGQIDGYRNSLDEWCPGSTVDVIRRTPDGLIYETNLVNCEQGADEHALVRILDGTYNRFVVHYAVRGESTMTPERQAEWLEELMAFHIVIF